MRHTVIIASSLALLVAAASLPAQAGAQSALDQLTRNARHWESLGRDDKAAESWERVLASDPGNPDALIALAIQRARAGRADEARRHLQALREASPGHQGIPQVEQAIAIGARYGSLLAEARAAANAGKHEEAVRIYRQIFGSAPPPDSLALEFYQTLGGTSGGWDEARRGLERLSSKSPGIARYRLALALQLSYREGTRRQAIALFEKLVSVPEVAERAQAGWRQALLWLAVTPADEPLFRTWQARYPRDTEVMARLARAERPAPAGPKTFEGFEALERADVDEAAKIFSEAEARASNDVDAAVGLGLVALRRGEFAKAKEIFEHVKEMAPNRPAAWENSLRSATFWDLVDRAKAAREAKDTERALSLLADARKVSGDEAAHAELIMAQIFADEGSYEDAEAGFRRLERDERVRIPALQGLVLLFIQGSRRAEATEANERLKALDPKAAFHANWMLAESMRLSAKDLARAGKIEDALTLLQGAHSIDPTHTWALHDLAIVQADLGNLEAARRLLEELNTLEPELLEAKLIEKRLLVESGRYAAALEVIDSIPEEKLSQSLKDEREELELRETLRRLQNQAIGLQLANARQSLLRLQWQVQGKPRLMELVADAWANLGEPDRGVAILAELMAKSAEPSPGLKLRYAGMLLAAGEADQLAALLRNLRNDGRLTAKERTSLEELRVGYGVQRTDKLRSDGEFERAFSHLRPLLQEYPKNGALLCALGRIFRGAGQVEEAYAVFLSVLRDDPEDLDARDGAIETALQLHRNKAARRLALDGIELHPRNARAQLVAGKTFLRIGDRGDGIEALMRAQALLEDGLVSAASVERNGISDSSSTSEILALASRRFSAVDAGDEPLDSRSATSIAQEIDIELGRLRAHSATNLGAAGYVRRRQGEDGLGALTELKLPLELSLPVGYAGRVRFGATPVSLDAGELELSRPDLARRFGSGRIYAPNQAGLPLNANGVELALHFETDNWEVEVGSSPLGFELQTVVGYARWRQSWDGVELRLEGGRRTVGDSVVSYAGVRDPHTNEVWGGATRNGGLVNLAVSDRDAVYYLYAGYDLILGTNIPDNQAYTGGGGIEWKVYDLNDVNVFTGINLTAFGYQENQRYFTFGHGGYFSPQTFVHAGVPFRWTGAAGMMRWDVKTSVGINWFQEDGVQVFPSSPALQAGREGAVDDDGEPLLSRYPARTSVAFGLDAEPQLFLAIGDRVEAGLRAALHKAEDYTEIEAGLFVRLALEGRRTQLGRRLGD